MTSRLVEEAGCHSLSFSRLAKGFVPFSVAHNKVGCATKVKSYNDCLASAYPCSLYLFTHQPLQASLTWRTAGGLLATTSFVQPAVIQQRLSTQVQALWGAIRQRSIFLPAIFVFLWQVSCAQQVPVALQTLSMLGLWPRFILHLGLTIQSPEFAEIILDNVRQLEAKLHTTSAANQTRNTLANTPYLATLLKHPH